MMFCALFLSRLIKSVTLWAVSSIPQVLKRICANLLSASIANLVACRSAKFLFFALTKNKNKKRKTDKKKLKMIKKQEKNMKRGLKGAPPPSSPETAQIIVFSSKKFEKKKESVKWRFPESFACA